MKEPTKHFENSIINRLSAVELKKMALQQHRQIELQNQLLASRDQRLFLLKSEDLRHSEIHDEEDRLRSFKERVNLQESKLNRLRAVQGQVNLQKNYNASLSNDLDSIRALFCEKEKELSLAVAKVEALTRQLEELKKNRRCTIKYKACNENAAARSLPIQTFREVEKLRRELLQHNQQSYQQDGRLQVQREALQQRKAELRSVNHRIFELQTRLQKKKVSNVQNCAQFFASQLIKPVELHHKYKQRTCVDTNSAASNIKQQCVTKPLNKTQIGSKVSDISLRRAFSGGNVAAVEPYIYTPASSITAQTNCFENTQPKENSQNSTNETLNKFSSTQSASFEPVENKSIKSSENDEIDYSKQVTIQPFTSALAIDSINQKKKAQIPNINQLYAEVGVKKRNAVKEMPVTLELDNNLSSHANHNATASKIPKSRNSDVSTDNTVNKYINKIITETNESFKVQENHGLEKSNNNNVAQTAAEKIDKAIESQPLVNLNIATRKPISSVMPTTFASSIPKKISYNLKVNCVAPNSVAGKSITYPEIFSNRPTLPPKPYKISVNESTATVEGNRVLPIDGTENNSIQTASFDIKNKPITTNSESELPTTSGLHALNINDSLPIKAKPLTIRKQPYLEQPRLKINSSNKFSGRKSDIAIHVCNSYNDDEIVNTPKNDNLKTSQQESSNASNLTEDGKDEEVDKELTHTPHKCFSKSGSKPKLIRRVSFDPLALLLDASLEGEVELVKKTALQVANPSASNDEGITALHNAICAGHFDIVKFLIEFGCDVNAQDSDGWTPLHCAASCNNLSMVKYLVENGACLFAVTQSDHETPAEKCEEDEEGFDGCSEYLYNIQDKLGILHNGEVFAVFSYEAQNNDELSFSINDRLNVLKKDDDAESEWWWATNCSGEEGYIPRNLLGLYPRVTAQRFYTTAEK